MSEKPLYKDWIFYLWILSIIAITPGTLLSSYNGSGLGSFVIGVIFQSFLFFLLPWSIRSNLRTRKISNTEQIDRKEARNKKIFTDELEANSHHHKSSSGGSGTMDGLVQVKVCATCNTEAQEMWHLECTSCGGTTFIHERRKYELEIERPEYKVCPMCAENIKFDAKKCRYCQHLLNEAH